jgi:hypothetical protein
MVEIRTIQRRDQENPNGGQENPTGDQKNPTGDQKIRRRNSGTH